MKPSRKIIFNIYDNDSENKINYNLISEVAQELPISGAVRFTLSNGSKLMAVKHDYVKNETYDIYWE